MIGADVDAPTSSEPPAPIAQLRKKKKKKKKGKHKYDQQTEVIQPKQSLVEELEL